jgi:hypothetical protein
MNKSKTLILFMQIYLIVVLPSILFRTLLDVLGIDMISTPTSTIDANPPANKIMIINLCAYWFGALVLFRIKHVLDREQKANNK